MSEEKYNVRILKRLDSDLLMAISPELNGLAVHAYSLDEMLSILPGAIEDLLEAMGRGNVKVQIETDEENTVPNFWPPAYVVKAMECAA